MDTDPLVRREIAAAESQDARRILSASAEVLLESLPGIGPVAAALLRESDKRRIERIEHALSVLKEDFATHGRVLGAMDSSTFAVLLQDWLERVQREHRTVKLAALGRLLSHCLVGGIDERNLDERLEFLRVLDDLSPFDCSVLGVLAREKRNFSFRSDEIDPHADQMAAVASARRLSVHGLVDTDWMPRSSGSSGRVAMAEITSAGARFVDFCLTESDHAAAIR